MRPLTLVATLGLLAGCQSFAKLEANDPSVSEVEVSAAGEVSDEELTPHLQHILLNRSEYSKEVVVAALASLGERHEPESVAVIAELSGDPDEEVRWHVAKALAEIGGPEARAVLDRMSTEDPSALVRAAAKE